MRSLPLTNEGRIRELFHGLMEQKPPMSWQEYDRLNKFYNGVQQAFGINGREEKLPLESKNYKSGLGQIAD